MINFKVHFFLLFLILTCSTNAQQVVTNYLFREFELGTIVMKNGERHELMVNYETLNSELVIVKGGVAMAMGKDGPQTIDSVYVNDRIFFAQKGLFLEVLYQSDVSLFVLHKSTIRMLGKDAGYGSTSQLGSIDQHNSYTNETGRYTVDVESNYEKNDFKEYYIRTDKLMQFTTKNEFFNLFPNHKKALKKFLRKEKIDLKSPNSVVVLAQYLDEIL